MKAIVSALVDEPVKKQAKVLAKKMGVSLSAIVGGLLTKMIQEQQEKSLIKDQVSVQLTALSDDEISTEDKEEIHFLKQQNLSYFHNL